jgi:hypothetical protein
LRFLNHASSDRFVPCDFASAIGGKTVGLDLLVCADLTQSCKLQDLSLKLTFERKPTRPWLEPWWVFSFLEHL